MRERFLNVAHVAGLEVHGASAAAGGEYGHASLAAKVVLPLVGIGVPMQFADAARLDGYDGSGDGRRYLEGAGINDAELTAVVAVCGRALHGSKCKIDR